MDSLEHEGQGYDIFWRGMRCPVPYCNYAGNFNNYSKLKLHWKNVHCSIVTLHMCPNCAKSFKNGKQELKRHMIKVHQTPKEKVDEMIKLSPYEKINDQFIDPQCIQIPALYLGEENQPQVAQREIELNTLRQREQKKRRIIREGIQGSDVYRQRNVTGGPEDLEFLEK